MLLDSCVCLSVCMCANSTVHLHNLSHFSSQHSAAQCEETFACVDMASQCESLSLTVRGGCAFAYGTYNHILLALAARDGDKLVNTSFLQCVCMRIWQCRQSLPKITSVQENTGRLLIAIKSKTHSRLYIYVFL